MKALLLIAAIVSLCACSSHLPRQAETNDPSVYYAQKGEEMTPTIKRVSQKNAGQTAAQNLSSTNAPAVR